jgi:hypothetical protein
VGLRLRRYPSTSIGDRSHQARTGRADLFRPSYLIPQLQKHLLHVGEPQRLVSWPAVLIERLELAGGNLILLQSIWRSEDAHVLDERFRKAGRQLNRLTGHGLKIGMIVEQTTPARGPPGPPALEAFAPGWGFGAADRER